MAEPSRKKTKKKKATRQRKERRFVPESTQGGKLVAIVGMVGAALTMAFQAGSPVAVLFTQRLLGAKKF